MFCPYCGTKLSEGFSFCPKCGKKILPKASSKYEQFANGDFGETFPTDDERAFIDEATSFCENLVRSAKSGKWSTWWGIHFDEAGKTASNELVKYVGDGLQKVKRYSRIDHGKLFEAPIALILDLFISKVTNQRCDDGLELVNKILSVGCSVENQALVDKLSKALEFVRLVNAPWELVSMGVVRFYSNVSRRSRLEDDVMPEERAVVEEARRLYIANKDVCCMCGKAALPQFGISQQMNGQFRDGGKYFLFDFVIPFCRNCRETRDAEISRLNRLHGDVFAEYDRKTKWMIFNRAKKEEELEKARAVRRELFDQIIDWELKGYKSFSVSRLLSAKDFIDGKYTRAQISDTGPIGTPDFIVKL